MNNKIASHLNFMTLGMLLSFPRRGEIKAFLCANIKKAVPIRFKTQLVELDPRAKRMDF